MSATTDTSTEAIDRLRSRVRGAVACAGEPGYELCNPWNAAIPVRPRAVVAVASADDVAETVRWAGEHGLRVAVQRTGHGAVALLDADVVLVHTGGLDELTIDAETGVARIGAGVVWQQVIEAAAPLGRAPLCGSAPTVGVVGFLTGGGVGPLVRTYGVSSDWVDAFDVVTGDGRLVRATPEENAELFWGLRGGKSTLGIVCGVQLRMPELAELYGGALYFDTADVAAVVRAWSDWAPTLPDSANTSFAIMQLPEMPGVPPQLAGKMTVAVRFCSVAGDDAGAAQLAPMRAVADPLIDAVAMMPYAAIGSVHADPPDPMPAHEDGGTLHSFDAAAADALLAVAGPDAGSPQAVVEVRLLGGALAAAPVHESAFCHRGAAFNLEIIGAMVPPIADVVPAHGASITEALVDWCDGGVLPNFAPELPADRGRGRYSEDARVWLTALAQRHDPAGVLAVGPVAREA